MKKARSPEPSRGSLRAMPEVDFGAYRVRKNPFAKRIAREGIEIILGSAAPTQPALERGPSRSSLREMPEVDLAKVARRNVYARRIAEEGISLQIGRGRPKRGEEMGPTVPRSVRLPEPVWELLAARAKKEGIPIHAALRAAVLEWLRRVA